MLERKAPLSSGTETYIDLIEREMEGGVSVQLPLESLAELFEHTTRRHLGGLVAVDEEIGVHDLSDD